MNLKSVCEIGISFIRQLNEIGSWEKLELLLTPENISITETSITLKSTIPPQNETRVLRVFPGYSAPEVYRSRNSAATGVYFVGAVLYKLQNGAPPPEATTRQLLPGDLFPGKDALSKVLNEAMLLNESARTENLGMLLENLEQANREPTPPQTEKPEEVEAPPAAQQQGRFMPPRTAPPPPSSPQQQGSFVPPRPAAPPQAPPPRGYGAPAVGYGTAPAGNWSTGAYGVQPQAPYASPPPYVPPGGQQSPYGAMPPPLAARPMIPLPPPTEEQLKRKKDIRRGFLIATLALVLLVAGLIGYLLLQFNRAETALDNQKFQQAYTIVNNVPWGKSFYSQIYIYSNARILLEEGKKEEATEMLDILGYYRDSMQLKQETRYEHAAELLAQGKMEQSLAVLQKLGAYEDSVKLAGNIQMYLMAESSQDPIEKYFAYSELGDFKDSSLKVEKALEGLYDAGMQAYKEGDFNKALSAFRALPQQEERGIPDYIKACEIWAQTSDMPSSRGFLAEIKEMVERIDIEPIVMSNAFFMVFLEGNWSSLDGGGAFNVGETDFEMTVLPLPDGAFSFRDKAIALDGEFYYTLAYQTYDELKITAVATSEEYIFHRK